MSKSKLDLAFSVSPHVYFKRVVLLMGTRSLLSDLSSLSTLSTSTTRRLDYTYYSLLSHLSSLTSTLAALSALSAASTSIHSSFSDTAQQMEREIRGQVQTFNSMTFEAQRERAELLEKRMKGARKKVEMLNGRMEHVRNKIEDFEQKENNARRRVRFTVRCVWGLSGMLIAVFALLFIAKHWSHVKNSLDGVDIGSLGHAALDVKPFPQTPEPLQSGREAEPPGDSAYVPAGWENGLRMLDEL